MSYNMIIGNKAKTTLPSVEAWGSTNSILRDPPKSISTRRKDRVDADGSMNKLYAESGDRFAESINVYARSVNPFVAVQYGPKLPYRIMDGGAFRPPQLTKEQLTPLSRQGRKFTSVQTNPEHIDYSKTTMCNAQKTPISFRQIKKPDMNANTTVIANKSHNIRAVGASVKEHYINIKRHVVENPIIVTADTNLSALENIQLVNRENYREVRRQINTNDVSANKSDNIHVVIEPENEYILKQKVVGHATTNIITNGDYEVNRTFDLPDTLKLGGFTNDGIHQSFDRNIDYTTDYSNSKLDLSKKMRNNII